MRWLWRSLGMVSTTTHQYATKQPLIAIIGATGTGKSNLAVELAKRFNGEIINGDAMQLYAGLPIITNKITKEEQQGIPHHLLGCIGLNESTWVVSTFVRRALQTIDDIRGRGKLPILVGGTHYYTQSLLFRTALVQTSGDSSSAAGPSMTPEEEWPILAEPTDVLLEELRKVDPVMVTRWHPKDRRKILRSLMIYLQTGRPASEVYAEQLLAKNGADQAVDDEESATPTLLRFPTLLFWVHAEKDALRSRLDERVETMLENGLLDEVEELREHARTEIAAGRAIDKTRGIWVSIGFKEFDAYHEMLQAGGTDEALAKARSHAIDKTQIANRQYAKQQVRWIRIKLLDALVQAKARDDLYILNSSDVNNFDNGVVQPAVKLTTQFLSGETRPLPTAICTAAALQLLEPTEDGTVSSPAVRKVEHCDVCNVTCATEASWAAHTKSKKHRKLTMKQRNIGTWSLRV